MELEFVLLTPNLARAVESWFDDPDTARSLGGRDWVHEALRLMRVRPGFSMDGTTARTFVIQRPIGEPSITVAWLMQSHPCASTCRRRRVTFGVSSPSRRSGDSQVHPGMDSRAVVSQEVKRPCR